MSLCVCPITAPRAPPSAAEQPSLPPSKTIPKSDSTSTGRRPTTIPRAAVDALHRKIVLSGARLVALSAPHRDAATVEVSWMLCQSFAARGIKTLPVDATAELRDDDELDAWVPGEPIRDGQIEGPSASHPTDILRIRATPRTRAMLNNPGRLQKTLRDDLAHYGSIIITLRRSSRSASTTPIPCPWRAPPTPPSWCARRNKRRPPRRRRRSRHSGSGSRRSYIAAMCGSGSTGVA